MSKLTSQTIRPCVGGVGYHVNRTPRAEEFAQIDEQLAAFGTDAVNGDTIVGPWSLAQDPNYAAAPTMTGSFTVSAAGAVVGTGPAGTLVCTGGTPPTYSSPRTRRIRYSLLEATRSYPHSVSMPLDAGCAPVVDSASGGIQTYSATFPPGASTPNVQITVPLVNPHNGTTPSTGSKFSSVVVYFYIQTLPSTLPTGNGEILFQSVNVVTGAVSTLGNTFIVPGSSLPVWWNGGLPQPVTISGLNTVVDLTTYVYRVVILDPGTSTPVYTAAEVNFTDILDEGFPL